MKTRLPRTKRNPPIRRVYTGIRFRILTDASGPFFTVVTETEADNFAGWEQGFSEMINRPWMGEWFGQMMPLVESGRRDFYTLIE